MVSTRWGILEVAGNT